jgi:hypothetical protein
MSIDPSWVDRRFQRCCYFTPAAWCGARARLRGQQAGATHKQYGTGNDWEEQHAHLGPEEIVSGKACA